MLEMGLGMKPKLVAPYIKTKYAGDVADHEYKVRGAAYIKTKYAGDVSVHEDKDSRSAYIKTKYM